MIQKKTSLRFLATAVLLGCLSACATEPAEKMPSDYTFFLPIESWTLNYYLDLNDHPIAQKIQEDTGVVIDYESPFPQEESMTFLLNLASQNLADILRVDLTVEYRGGVEMAIEDGMIHDLTPLIQTHAPNFMARIEQDPAYEYSAYNDQGVLFYFGATLPDPELRGLPSYGPMINQGYLDEFGLEVPQTIAQWEEMLDIFHQNNITPFSFGGEDSFAVLYDSFASAYGVTVGDLFFQENQVVKCSPLEEGYYDFLCLFQKWYENGWLDKGFSALSQDDFVKLKVEQGQIASSVLPLSSIQNAAQNQDASGNAIQLVAAPYPVLNQGDEIHSRHYTLDFYDAPIYIHSRVQDPVPIIQWIDYFYGEEGVNTTVWGTEGLTYMLNDQGEKVFTDYVTNNPEGNMLDILTQETLEELSLVLDWENQAQFYDDSQKLAWEVWGKADYDGIMPQTITYTTAENDRRLMELYLVEGYVYDMTVKFITGQEPLEKYPDFIQELHNKDILGLLAIEQSALDRYWARGAKP